MRGVSRHNNLEALARIYLYAQNENVVYNKENATSYSYEKGRLVGFCMACDYDIYETSDYLKIKLRTGTTILEIDKIKFFDRINR